MNACTGGSSNDAIHAPARHTPGTPPSQDPASGQWKREPGPYPIVMRGS